MSYSLLFTHLVLFPAWLKYFMIIPVSSIRQIKPFLFTSAIVWQKIWPLLTMTALVSFLPTPLWRKRRLTLHTKAIKVSFLVAELRLIEGWNYLKGIGMVNVSFCFRMFNEVKTKNDYNLYDHVHKHSLFVKLTFVRADHEKKNMVRRKI